MANIDDPNGFTPTQGVGGSAGHRIREYVVAAAYGTDIGIGALCMMDDGEVIIAAAGAVGAADAMVVGVAASQSKVTGVARTVLIYDDPDQVFEGQLDDNTQTTRATMVGKNFAHVTGATNALTGRSTDEVDGTTPDDADGAHYLHCIDVVTTPRNGNDVSAANTRILFKITGFAHFHGNAPFSS